MAILRIAALSLIGASLAAAPALADEATVKVGHNRLEPRELVVKAGTTVRFHNEDEMPGGHTIVADDGSFKSPGLAKDQDWSHKFEKPGTYAYSIEEHPSARGKIVVK
jgi:plastocyanin